MASVTIMVYSKAHMLEVIKIKTKKEILNESISQSVNQSATFFEKFFLYIKPSFAMLGMFNLN